MPRACPTACAGPRWKAEGSRRSRRSGPGTAAPASTKVRSRGCSEHPDADIRAWSVRLIGDEPPCLRAAGGAAGRDGRHRARRRGPRPARLHGPPARARPRARRGVSPARARPGRRRPAPPAPPLVGRGAARDRRPGTRHRPVHGARRLAIGDDPVNDPGPADAAVCRWKARPAGEEACARLLASAPSEDARRPLLAALDEAMRGEDRRGRAGPGASDHRPGGSRPPRRDADPAGRPVRQPAGGRAARAVAADRRSPEPDRLAMLDLLGDLKDRASLGLLLDLATRDDSASSSVRSAAFAALGRFEDESIASALLAAYPRQDEAWQVAGPGAAPEPGLVGAGLPRRDRPRRTAGQGDDARPARALRRAPGAGPRRNGTQALGRDPRRDARGAARRGPPA